mgnify:FL=1
MTTLRQRLVALLTAATTALALTACSGGSHSSSGSIDVLSWWTSASESSALDTLIDQHKQRNPEASVDEIAVVGGGGSQAHVTLATRIANGDAPDVWQSLVGGNITAWHNANAVGDVSSLFSDEVKAQLPDDVLSSVTVDGKQYAAPMSVHRANVLMYNRDVLEKAGIAEPGEGYSLTRLLADLDTLKAKGTTPMCIGAADSITTAGLFESVLLATVGQEGWEKIEADRFDWNGQEVKDALGTFGQLIDHSDYADQADRPRTWDEASSRLAAGECGFYQMNDSALGESLAVGDSAAGSSTGSSTGTADGSAASSTAAAATGSATDASPVSSAVFPGTEGSFLMVADAFVTSSSTDNRDGADAFLTSALDPEVQTTFCKVKGCVPTRNDADVSSLSSYQQQAAGDLRSQTVLSSISYGEVISPAVQDGFFQAVKSYISTRDASSFGRVLTDRVNEGAGGPANH